MKTGTAIAAGLMLGAAGLMLAWPRQVQAADDGEGFDSFGSLDPAPEAETDEAPSIFQRVIDGVFPVALNLEDANLQAFLSMIRHAEGTAGRDGYRTLFGGRLFDSFDDHPRVKVTARLGGREIVSTAAGAYQILSRTWDEAAAALGLADFSPASQDMAAAWLIRRRGALRDVIAGRLDTAIAKCAKEWASLPGSPYGQPVISIETARRLFAAAGGRNVEGSVYA